MDLSAFARNRCSHSPEELAPYQEKHVAWSTDGKQILACGETWEELYREIDRQGITDYVIGFIPGGHISDLGGGLL